MSQGEVRQSQLITTYGPGAMVAFLAIWAPPTSICHRPRSIYSNEETEASLYADIDREYEVDKKEIC